MRYPRTLGLVGVLVVSFAVATGGHAGEAKKPDPKKEALKQARLKWLDEQVRFIEALGGLGYEDLAKRVKSDTQRGVGSPDGKALDGEEKKAK